MGETPWRFKSSQPHQKPADGFSRSETPGGRTETSDGNFLRSAPFAVAASAVALSQVHLEPAGILLALTSGAVTSGMGYVLWYRVLRSLTTAQASTVQLSVPVLAAFGGVAFLSEDVSTRLVAASAIILGSVALAVLKGHSSQSLGVPDERSKPKHG